MEDDLNIIYGLSKGKTEITGHSKMAFIKEELEDTRISESRPFRVKHEDVEKQTDLKQLKDESPELNEMVDKAAPLSDFTKTYRNNKQLVKPERSM
ncbi:gastrula zinc finger protein XlCGF8.2DB-like [Pimephales promelas]|nr:gastrula zinc finger protein XlCGF8.2DB-like [Pimephales promelas]